MARYVDLSDKGPASGNDGLLPTTPWNLADITSGGSEDNTGETVFLKGFEEDLTIQPTKFRRATTFQNWGDTNAYGVDQNDGNLTDDFFPVTDLYSVTRMILNFTHTNRGNAFNTCTFINNFDLTINENTNPGSAFVTMNGCTFNMNGNDIITQVGMGGSAVNVTFNSCMIIDGVFNNGGGANCTVTCNDCLFTNKSQAQVEAAFIGAGNTITFNNCDFLTTPLPQAFPSRCKDALGPDDKDALYFDLFLYGPSHPTFPDSLMLGNGGGGYVGFDRGLFNGERRGRGAFWFANTYYVNFASKTSIGSQDGLSASDAFGINDFLAFTDKYDLISGRGFREGDKIKATGNYSGFVDVILRFPSHHTTLMEYFGHLGDDPNFRQVEFTPDGTDPVFINDEFQNVDFGSGNHFIEYIARQSVLSTRLYNVHFTSCILIHEDEIKFNYDFAQDSDNRMIGCSIVTPIIRLQGNPTTATNPSLIFNKCYLFGYTSPEAKIQIVLEEAGSTSPGNDSVFYSSNNANFRNGPITFNGKTCISGNIDFDAYCSGTVFKDETAFLASGGSNEVIMEGDYTFEKAVYFNKTLTSEESSINPSENTIQFNDISGFDDLADLNNTGTSEIRMDENTYFNGSFTGTIADLNNKDFTHDGDLVNPGLQITNFNSVIDNGGPIDLTTTLGFNCAITPVPAFQESSIPVDKVFLWSSLKGPGSPAIGFPGGDPDQLTANFAEGIWSYINGLGKLHNGYAVIRVNSQMSVRTGDGTFDKKIILINESDVEVLNFGANTGWYNCGPSSVTVIYNKPGGLLVFGQKSGGGEFFRGYIINEGTATMGQSTFELSNIEGAIHDIAGGTNQWYGDVAGLDLTYSTDLMNEIGAIGLVDGVGTIVTGVDHHVDIVDSAIWSTEPEFTTVSSIYLFIEDSSSLYNIIPNTFFATSLPDYENKFRTNFFDYNDAGNLEIGAALDAPGLFGSTRNQDAVGAWFFGGAPASPRDYYVDLDLETSGGDGTSGDPLNSSEIRSYFDSSGSFFPVDTDNVFIRGKEVADEANWWTMNLGSSVSIDIKAWDLSLYGPYVIELGPGLAGADVSFIFGSASGGGSDAWDIRDLVLTAPHKSIGTITFADINTTGSSMTIANTMIITDNDLVLARSDNDPFTFTALPSTFSVNDGSNIISGTSAVDIELFDTVINLGVGSEYLPGASNSVEWTNCECTLAEADVIAANPGITLNTSTFDAVGIRSITTSITAAEFDLDNLVFNNFNVVNQGSGSAQWTTWDTLTGIGGLTRYGPGALHFAPTQREFYYDLEQAFVGDGTPELPFNLGQFKNYFDANSGESSYIIPVEDDTLYVRGSTQELVDDYFINIDYTIDGTVNVKAWDLNKYGIWLVDTLDNTSGSDSFFFITNSNNNYIEDLNISDFALIENETAVLPIITTLSPYLMAGSISANTRLTLRNAIMHGNNSRIFFGLSMINIEVYCYGCTFITPSQPFNLLDGDSKDSKFFDCQIKATDVFLSPPPP
jgi:hypothetical protein